MNEGMDGRSMTFRRRWFSRKVVSSDGYSVTPVGPSRILYEDGQNRLYVTADLLAEPNHWLLYPDDMRQESEQGRRLQDDTVRAQVTARIREVLEFLGGSLEM
jgi:hypothetical protein